uniref:Uncharacterized protein n=1 Tax=Romanomermis culicivorax TaxID=13658 RepID=A0A915KHB4_ROMCU
MGVCLAFVFGVMIEFTIVNYWSRRKPSIKNCPDHLRMATVQPSSLKQRLRKKLRLVLLLLC